MLKVDNLNKKMNNFELSNISFSVEKGSIMGFIGSNGAGKSTTIKSILNLTNINSGNITYFNGLKLNKDVKQDIGVVFEECYYFNMVTADGINKMCKSIYKNWDEALFKKYMNEFGLDMKQHIKEYSKGMTMKISIAVALSHKTKLLILDEALNGLDLNTRMQLIEVFSNFVKDKEHSILISSHIISDLEKLCDKITYIDNGKILFSEDKEILLNKFDCIKCKKQDINNYCTNHNVYTVRDDAYILVEPNKYKEARPATIEDIILIANGKI